MFVLDTNVISEMRLRTKANPNVMAWTVATPADQTFLSAITILEIEVGVQLIERKDKRQGQNLRAWIDGQVLPGFEGRILPVDTAVAQCCAGLHVPKTKADRDAMIAATAIVHAMTVVTRNVRDFSGMSVKLLNPWL